MTLSVAATAVFFVKSSRLLSTSTTLRPLSAAAVIAGITSGPIGVITMAWNFLATASSICAVWHATSDGVLQEK